MLYWSMLVLLKWNCEGNFFCDNGIVKVYHLYIIINYKL